MKTQILTLLIICLSPCLVFAKGPGPGSGGPYRAEPGMAALEQFLSMSDSELEQLEETIRRIRQMTPDEREQYRRKLATYQQLPDEQRQHIRNAWGKLDARIRAAWREYMMALEAGERQRVHERLRAAEPESRTRLRLELLREAGLLDDAETGAD